MNYNSFMGQEMGEDLKELILTSVVQSPCPIVITNLDGVILYVNPMFTSYTGYSSQEAIGKSPRILSAGKTAVSVYKDLWTTILSGDSWHGELCNKKKNGEEFWEALSINCIKNSNGTITHFVAVWQDVTTRRKRDDEEREKKEHFEKQSQTDELTGLYNRRHIFLRLEKEFERAKRYHRPLSGMMIDVDNFKKMNDLYGHLTGDRILRAFANVLTSSIRSMDILGRYGGDEFLLILPETTLDKAKMVAARIRNNLRDYQENVMDEFGVLTASIGLVAVDESCQEDKAIFLEKIDKVLLLAKRAGKNTVVVG